jgi:hypothetical protein
MNRADAVSFLAPRYAKYLATVARTASDVSGGLKEPIDDAFVALGTVLADVPTAQTLDAEGDEDLRVQLNYRLMLQLVRDLATNMDVSSQGDSIRLSQIRAAAEKDLMTAAAAVMDRFGTLGAISISDDADLFTTLDLNFLEERWPCGVAV